MLQRDQEEFLADVRTRMEFNEQQRAIIQGKIKRLTEMLDVVNPEYDSVRYDDLKSKLASWLQQSEEVESEDRHAARIVGIHADINSDGAQGQICADALSQAQARESFNAHAFAQNA